MTSEQYWSNELNDGDSPSCRLLQLYVSDHVYWWIYASWFQRWRRYIYHPKLTWISTQSCHFPARYVPFLPFHGHRGSLLLRRHGYLCSKEKRRCVFTLNFCDIVIEVFPCFVTHDFHETTWVFDTLSKILLAVHPTILE